MDKPLIACWSANETGTRYYAPLPSVGCAGCGRPYGDVHGFPDMLIPDDVWRQISPDGDEGGLLCPSCICERVEALGLTNVPHVFTSGPFGVGSFTTLEVSNHQRRRQA